MSLAPVLRDALRHLDRLTQAYRREGNDYLADQVAATCREGWQAVDEYEALRTAKLNGIPARTIR